MEQAEVDAPEASPSAATFGEVRVDRSDVIEGLRTIPELFIDFFMHDVLTVPTPAFHVALWMLMTNIVHKYIAIAVPRQHAKTTLAKLAVVWYFLFTDYRFIVYVSNTSDVAAQACVDIVNFIRSDNFKKVFGPPIFTKELTGEGHYQFTITNPLTKQTKQCILMARGANQQIRGLNIDNQRPQVAVVDDLESADNTETVALQAKLVKWFYGTFMKALDKTGHKIIMIGNMVNSECLLKKVCDSPRWTSVRYGAILANGTPLWPELWPISELIADYQEYARMGLSSVWYAEMMNLITAGENAIIQIHEIPYKEILEESTIRGGFITIDPATGTGGDDTAIVVHLLVGLDEYNLVPQVVDYKVGQFDELATVNLAIELMFRWGVNIIAIEATAYQRALGTLFEVIFATRGIIDYTILQGNPTSSKLLRIRAWCALLKSKAYLLTLGEIHITKQLLDFNPMTKNNRDDLIDACSQGPEVVAQFLALILSKAIGTMITAKVVREHQMC